MEGRRFAGNTVMGGRYLAENTVKEYCFARMSAKQTLIETEKLEGAR